MIVKNNSVEKEKLENGISRKILARGGNLMMVEVCFEKGGIGAIHSHSHEQISYIHKGSFEFILNEEKEIVQANDTVYIPANIPHGVKALEDSIIIDVFTPQREDFLRN